MLETAVTSEIIAHLKWDSSTLFITFNKGKVFKYADVPLTVYNEMVESQSVGSFFHKEVKGKYAFEEVPTVPAA
jgi:hypothetical protein